MFYAAVSGGLSKVDILFVMLLAAKNTHICYHEELKPQKLIAKKHLKIRGLQRR